MVTSRRWLLVMDFTTLDTPATVMVAPTCSSVVNLEPLGGQEPVTIVLPKSDPTVPEPGTCDILKFECAAARVHASVTVNSDALSTRSTVRT